MIFAPRGRKGTNTDVTREAVWLFKELLCVPLSAQRGRTNIASHRISSHRIATEPVEGGIADEGAFQP